MLLRAAALGTVLRQIDGYACGRAAGSPAPNAGARPPALVGRDAELQAFEVLLNRLRHGYTEQSLLITGLRGVGKTEGTHDEGRGELEDLAAIVAHLKPSRLKCRRNFRRASRSSSSPA